MAFHLGVPSRICFHTTCMEGSNAEITINRLKDSKLDPICVLGVDLESCYRLTDTIHGTYRLYTQYYTTGTGQDIFTIEK